MTCIRDCDKVDSLNVQNGRNHRVSTVNPLLIRISSWHVSLFSPIRRHLTPCHAGIQVCAPLTIWSCFSPGGRGGGKEEGKEEEEGGTQQMFIRVQPLSYTLVYTILHEKGSLSVYLLLTNSTLFTYLV